MPGYGYNYHRETDLLCLLCHGEAASSLITSSFPSCRPPGLEMELVLELLLLPVVVVVEVCVCVGGGDLASSLEFTGFHLPA